MRRATRGLLLVCLATMIPVMAAADGEERSPLPFVVAGCVETREAPVIDGRLDEAVWEQAGKASRFVRIDDGREAGEQTVAYLLHDRDHLFMGFHCAESEMDSVRAAARQRDTIEVGMDDCVEVFLIPPENRFLEGFQEHERYFHIMLNTLATQYDEVGYNTPSSWNAEWRAATYKGGDYWGAEIAISFSALLTGSPEVGETWKANFNREEKRMGENSGWAAVDRTFHQPWNFGRVVFVREPEEAQTLEVTALREGVLLSKVKGTARKVKETAASLRALNTTLDAAKEASRKLARFARELKRLGMRIESLAASDILERWRYFDNKLTRLEKETDLAVGKVLSFGLYTREQLMGKAPEPAYFAFVSRAITNKKLLPHHFARRGKWGEEISLVACPGEVEPASFSVYALQDLRDVEVAASPLTGSGGPSPAAPSVDVRVVKCWFQAGPQIWETARKILTPELLLKDADLVRVDLEKGENFLRSLDANGAISYVSIGPTWDSRLPDIAPKDAETLQPVQIPSNFLQQFWVTVRVPEEATPGEYRGTIHIQPAGLPGKDVPVKVKVLPFHLEEPLLEYSIYYRGVLNGDGKGSITSEAKSESQYLAEMRNLKEHGVIYPTLYQGYHPVLLGRALELRAEAGLPKGALYALGIGAGWERSPGEMEALRRSVELWLEVVREHGYDQLYIYGIDEAGGEELTAERAAWQAAHEAGAKIFVACGADFWERVGDLLDLPVWAGLPGADVAEKVHSVGHRIWNYGNPQVGNEEPETYRRNFGLALWKAGYDGACDYAYQHSFHHIWNDFDDPSFRDHVFAYPTVDGVIDTVQWEGFREGVDDVRYLSTLLKAIEQAKANKGKRQLVTEAQKWVKAMDVMGDLDALRAKIVEWILRLRNG